MTNIQKTILTVYALVLAGGILAVIPIAILPVAGLSCLLVATIAAYIYRARDRNLLIQSHMTHIIRTVWLSSLVLLIGVMVFCGIILSNGDLSMIYAMNDAAQQGIIPSENDIRLMQHQFLAANHDLILIAAMWGLLPYPLYLIYRLGNGVRRVITGK